jgi:hypothetical protein
LVISAHCWGRVDAAGALDGHVGAGATGQVEHRPHRIGLASVDHIHPAAGGRHRAGPFVAGRVVPERRRLREVPVEDLQVGPAGAAHRHPDEDLVRPRPRDAAVDHAHVAGAEQHRGAHHLRYVRPGSQIGG